MNIKKMIHTAALVTCLAQTPSLLSIPSLQELSTQAGQLAIQTGTKVWAQLPEQQDKRTIVLAAGAATATYFTWATLGALWNRCSKNSPKNRIDSLEQRTETIENSYSTKQASLLYNEIVQMQTHVACLKEEMPFWGKLGKVLANEAEKRGQKPPTAEQYAQFVLNTMGALPQAQPSGNQ